MGTRLKWIIAAIVGLAVIVVGGFWVYAAVDKAPAKLSLTDETGTTTTLDTLNDATTVATSAGIAGTWKPTSKSVVGYRVKETLFGASNEAYGRTSSIAGSMTIAGTDISAVDLTVDMGSISSDRAQRDGQFRGRIMQTSTFPTATFKLTSPIALGSEPAAGTPITKKATGQLTLHGVTKTVTFDVKAQHKSDGTVEVNGQIPITFADYNISDPSGGPAQTEDHGILEFLVVFSKA
ncbi:MAG TPA: YceI family protein [Acidimicrobiales bacterium]|nr:YceI family protein [Acidimicrobiales bacterium]